MQKAKKNAKNNAKKKSVKKISITLQMSQKKADALFDLLLATAESQGYKYGKHFTFMSYVEDVES